MEVKTVNEKYELVLSKNTFYFSDPEFEEKYEIEIEVLSNILYNLQAKVQQKGTVKELFEEVLQKEMGLRAVLALNGFSGEQLKRIITLSRIVQDETLDNLLNRFHWSQRSKTAQTTISEWSIESVEKMVIKDPNFRRGVINLFFEGSSNPLLSRTLPPFELKKLSIRKLSFKIEDIIDTLVRYKVKGSRSAQRGNNPENALRVVLEDLNVAHQSGDLDELVNRAFDQKRTMDFIIPNKQKPRLIVECSFLVTTTSGQGDKSKTEIGIRNLLKTHYPNVTFVGFVDGIGWYVRPRDLKRMVAAYDDVFTFHEDELQRFRQLVVEVMSRE